MGERCARKGEGSHGAGAKEVAAAAVVLPADIPVVGGLPLTAVLPGGAGSLDEFFEVLTWAQLGLHAKPIYLVDVAGYWQPLSALLGHVVEQGFADESLLDLLQIVPDVESLIDALRRS